MRAALGRTILFDGLDSGTLQKSGEGGGKSHCAG